MRQNILRAIFCLAVVFVSPLVPCRVSAQAVTTYPGALPDGATYLIEVPPNWNGTLFLYSHEYVVPGSPNLAQDVGNPATRFFMLSSGFALAGPFNKPCLTRLRYSISSRKLSVLRR
jgi:hypothetical protein